MLPCVLACMGLPQTQSYSSRNIESAEIENPQPGQQKKLR